MGKIEKIIKKGSVEGQTTEVYPVTSTKAVYDENNKRLDNIITGLQESVYLKTPIPISTDNTIESKAQNVKNIADYIEKAKAAGIADVNGMGVTCLIDDYLSGVGYIYRGTNVIIHGIKTTDDLVDNRVFIIENGTYYESKIQSENSIHLNTKSKKLVPAINEVNTLAESKGNGTITEVRMNGVSKGTSGVVDLGTVITAHQDISGKQDKLVSGTNIKTINGESVLGSGDITISSDASSSAYPEVNHGTGDTTFTLTPNTFHVWDKVTSLTLNFGNETSGVANEYLFQFTSGSTATSLTLPDSIKWANDNVPTIGANMIYQVSVLRGLASVLEFNNAIVFPIIGPTGGSQNREYAKVYRYFRNTYNLTNTNYNPSNGVIITETLICNDADYGGPVLKVSLVGIRLLLWTQKAIDKHTVPILNDLGIYSTYPLN